MTPYKISIDFDYCSTCYEKNIESHNQAHVFALLRFPTSRFWVRRFKAYTSDPLATPAVTQWVLDTRAMLVDENDSEDENEDKVNENREGNAGSAPIEATSSPMAETSPMEKVPTAEDSSEQNPLAEAISDQAGPPSPTPEGILRCQGWCGAVLSGTRYKCLLCSSDDHSELRPNIFLTVGLRFF